MSSATPAPPPPLPAARPALIGTTLILLPALTAVAGALLINHLHFNDGLSLLRRTPHFWRTLWHMILFVAAVAAAAPVGVIALCGYGSRLGAFRRRALFLLNLAAVIGAWFLCQPRASYASGLEAGYAALDHKTLQAECATMTALVADAPFQRNYLLLCADAPCCKKWWPRLPPYVASLDPQWIYIEPDRVVLVLDYRFVEAGTADNGLYVPLSHAARFAPSDSLRPIPSSPTLRLDNHHWERFRSDPSNYTVFPDVPPPERRPPATRTALRRETKTPGQ